MKFILLCLLSFYNIIVTNSRLLDSVKERTLPTDTKTVSSTPVRLARQIDATHDEDTFPGSEESDVNSEEFQRSEKKKVRNNKPKHEFSKYQQSSRIPRGSGEHSDRQTKNVTTTSSAHTPVAHPRPKSKPVLIKKPIPKYNEMDYDDDFQMKVNRSPIKVVDSGEHEDEDFNLNDYDFDVNHDEFVGRGKPLEPRIKHKEMRENTEAKPEAKAASISEPKHKNKPNMAPVTHRASSKKGRSAEKYRKASEKEDYYDEVSSTPSKPKTTEKQREVDDESNEDNEESKEYENKVSARVARSLRKMNYVQEKHGGKRSMSKILSILPMFPEWPGHEKRFEYNVGDEPSFSWSVNIPKE